MNRLIRRTDLMDRIADALPAEVRADFTARCGTPFAARERRDASHSADDAVSHAF